MMACCCRLGAQGEGRRSIGRSIAPRCEAIREERRPWYGADIGRIAPMAPAERYGNYAHYIFESLEYG